PTAPAAPAAGEAPSPPAPRVPEAAAIQGLGPQEAREKALAEIAGSVPGSAGGPVAAGEPAEAAAVAEPVAATEPAAVPPAALIDEEDLQRALAIDRQAEMQEVNLRIFYPDELYGAPMVRSTKLEPGMVLFYYPLRSVGGVTVKCQKDSTITVEKPNEAEVTVIKDILKKDYLDKDESVDWFKNLNMLAITAKEENVPFILDVLNFLDSPRKQVIIEAAVWEITETKDTQLGTEVSVAKRTGGGSFFNLFENRFDSQAFLESLYLTTPYQGSTLQFVTNADANHAQMTLVFQFLKTRGYADIVAQPRMRVAVGEVARIVTGEEIPYAEYYKITRGNVTTNIKYKTVGVQLYVVPMLAGQDMIKVALTPRLSDVIGYTTSGGAQIAAPRIATREAATVLWVADKELITIGGLDQTRKIIEERKVPILGDIPILKYLFSSKRETTKKVQLWFTVRPTLASESDRIIMPELTGAGGTPPALPK
ncbi:MAG: hypothetical protein J7M19_07670, partial [Planctomycetes bacterium]|nr:hypothetical protein [Planctomycetota bacterium]